MRWNPFLIILEQRRSRDYITQRPRIKPMLQVTIYISWVQFVSTLLSMLASMLIKEIVLKFLFLLVFVWFRNQGGYGFIE